MEDEKIVGLFWQRNETAIVETAAKYGALCHSVAKGVLGSSCDAEECVNDTYVRMWNSIPPDQPDHLDAYACKITRRLALDKYRRSTAEKRSAAIVTLVEEIAEALPDGDGDAIERIAVRDTLNRFIMSLSPTNRMIFMRRYWYCDAVRDIARAMHMTETGVTMRLTRMRRKLRKALGAEGVTV